MTRPFQNLYLVAGIWGDFRLRGTSSASSDPDVLRTFEEWGLPLPWGPCDSGVDFGEEGEDRLRVWGHVDLRLSNADQPEDVPVAGLLRSMWDALELYGELTALSGVVAILPPPCAAHPLWRRVRMKQGTLFDVERTAGSPPAHVRLQIAMAWDGSDSVDWRSSAVLEYLQEHVEVRAFMDDAGYLPFPASTIEHPFVSPVAIEHPFGPSETDPFRAEVVLPVWSVDDAAWLAEAVADACHRAGIAGDVQIAVRSL